ncbi:MAG: hypothetical protein A2Y24_00590 [Clostridiales bacterium GWE2_32_10]|nr:MAG: hypothetical protein A2Y24_00590 [Clostridiales bacterium GWE2_32_10]HBY21243.1 hypothetical protein [Clostridiales bacterium]
MIDSLLGSGIDILTYLWYYCIRGEKIMARKQRIHYEDVLYHAMARGNNGKYILKTGENKKSYIGIVRRYKAEVCNKDDYLLHLVKHKRYQT